METKGTILEQFGLGRLVGRKQVLLVVGMVLCSKLDGWPLIAVASLAVVGALIQGVLDWRQPQPETQADG